LPKQILPRWVDFTRLQKSLLSFHFRQIPDQEFVDQYNALKLVAPRPREGGREVGFVFKANELKVTVWTTWLLREQRARKKDSAWVVISDEKKVFYFSHPIHRTKNFIDNICKQAWIAMYRVKYRPRCKECGKFMQIIHGKGAKSCYWSCSNRYEHDNNKKVYLEWDYNLPSKAKQYLKGLRRKRATYRERRRAANLPTDVSRKKRISWVIKKKKSL